MRAATCFLATLGLILLAAATLAGRTFTYKNSRTIDGELLDLTGNQVALSVPGRQQPLKIAIDRFAPADQKFIRESFVKEKDHYPRWAPPAEAIEAGYRFRTFHSEFRASTVDMSNSKASGFQWYPWSYFGHAADRSKIRLNEDGSVTLLGDTDASNGQLCTAVPGEPKDKFVGTVFGGGAYFEATFKFDPQSVIKTNFKGWPSWWSLSVEMSLNNAGSLWPGQAPDYRHAVEADFFEYLLGDEVKKGNLNCYAACMHDWYGVWAEQKKYIDARNGAPGYRDNIRQLPADAAMNEYHQYGFLWVPATAEKKGYAKYFFDRQEIGKSVSWERYTNQPPPPGPPWLYSIIDKHRRFLIIGTGADQPLTVKSVEVWQKHRDDNQSF